MAETPFTPGPPDTMYEPTLAELQSEIRRLKVALAGVLRKKEEEQEESQHIHDVRIYTNSQEEPRVPKIHRWDKASKIKLEADWESYLRECKDRNRQPVSITQTLPREIAEKIIWVELNGVKDSLTETFVMAAIADAKLSTDTLDNQGIFRKLNKILRWDNGFTEGTAAFDSMLGDMWRELDAANLLHYARDGLHEEASKKLIKILTSKIQPPAIRTVIYNECDINRTMAKDLKVFRKFVHEWLERNDKIRLAEQQHAEIHDKDKKPLVRNANRVSAFNNESNGASQSTPDATTVSQPNQAPDTNRPRQGRRIAATELRLPEGRCCFACQSNSIPGFDSHYFQTYSKRLGRLIRSCPIKWDDEANACYLSVDQILRNKNKSRPNQVTRTAQRNPPSNPAANSSSTAPTDSRANAARSDEELEPIEATIHLLHGDDRTPVKGILDPGARETFVPTSITPFCRDLEFLPIPMKVKMGNNTSSFSKQRGRADFHIATENSNFTVLNVEVYLVEGDWPEFLLGAPLLTILNCMPHQVLKFNGEVIDCLAAERRCRSVRIVESFSEQMDEAFATDIPDHFGIRCRRVQATDPKPDISFIIKGNLPPEDARSEDGAFFSRLDQECMDRSTYADNITINDDEVNAQIRKAIRTRLANCEGPGITPLQLQLIGDLLERNIDAFGCDQAACKLSQLTPMKVELIRPDVKPCVAKARHFGQIQLDFLRKKIDTLVKIGMLIPSTDPTFSSASFVVPKKTGNDFRLVVDMRPLNTLVKRSAFSMPLIEDQLGRCLSAQFMGTFDVLSGYDMLRVDPESQKYFGIVTPFGVFNMTGAPMGFCNSGQIYSHRMISEVLGDLFARKDCGIIQWLDDSLVYAPTFDEYLRVLEKFLSNLKNRGVRLNVDKCYFVTRCAHWCGRTIKDGTWCFDDSYYDTITTMSPPRTADELAQAVHLANWLVATVPEATEIMHPLREILNKIYAHVGTRRTVKIRGIPLVHFGWNATHIQQWNQFREALARATRLALYDPALELCVLSDASDNFYAACLSQISPDQLDLPLPKQSHRPLFFLSGEFSGNMRNWHISQKEIWPVMKVFERFKFICAAHPKTIWVYNDHANLRSILHPGEKTSLVTLGRLHRWAIILSEFTFEVIPTSSEDNFFADCLSRWAASERFARKPTPQVSRCRSVQVSPSPDNAAWISFMEDRLSFLSPAHTETPTAPVDRVSLYRSQLALLQTKRSLECEFIAAGTPPVLQHRENGRILVPLDMTEKILVALHIAHGHPSPTHMKDLAKAYHFMASNVNTAIDNLCRVCLHCDGPSRLIRRPFGTGIHAQHRSEVLHADFLYITRDSYLLVITDDLSRKVELTHTQSADSATAADALTFWAARYGLHPECTLVTDGGSHFASQLISALITRLRMRHHIVVAYSPWANGSAEVENKTVLRIIRSLCSEFRLQPADWHLILPSLMQLINNNPTVATGMSPNQIYFGREFASPILPVHANGRLLEPLDPDRVAQLAIELQDELRDIAFQVSSLRDHIRSQAQQSMNERKGVSDIQFQPGDYVWVSTSEIRRGRGKTRKIWQAPFQIDEVVSPFRYRIRDLRGKTEEVHVQRLRYYDGSQLEISPSIREQFLFDDASYEVDEIVGVRWSRRDQRFELRVRWAGFQVADDTWEPAKSLYDQIPFIVQDYLTTEDASNTVAKNCLEALTQP